MFRKLFYLIILIAAVGCSTINPSIMFKTKKDYKYAVLDTATNTEYRIAPNDVLDFKIYSNDGYKLVDVTSITITTGILNPVQYLVELDGNVKFPVIGRVSLQGYTSREAQKILEEKYSVYYNKPFVFLKVINKRVMIFPGSGGAGHVLTLQNENTTLLEAIALAGGLSSTGKARRIKLIRNNEKNPQVQLIDLSTINGLKQANIVLQANDIIYVDPVPKITEGVLAQITPIVGILSSFLLIYNIFIQKR